MNSRPFPRLAGEAITDACDLSDPEAIAEAANETLSEADWQFSVKA